MTIELIHGDSLKILPEMPDGSFKLMCYDPPYGLPMWHEGTFDWHLNDGDMDATTALVRWSIEQAARLLDEEGYLYMTAGTEVFAHAVITARRLGFKTKPFAWIKPNPMPGFPGNPWRNNVELVLWGYRKHPKGVRYPGSGLPNYLIIPSPAGKKRWHPTQKPVELFELFMRHTPLGRVLDPFMGVGSSLMAAQAVGLDGVGIEIEKKWVDLAELRLSGKGTPIRVNKWEGTCGMCRDIEALGEDPRLAFKPSWFDHVLRLHGIDLTGEGGDGAHAASS